MSIYAIGPHEPAGGSALLLRGLAFGTAAIAMLTLNATVARCAGAKAIVPEVDCNQIRESVHRVAKVERDEALALHLMADGKPTPMVQTRLTELQARIGELRETLKQARRAPHDSNLSDCIEMGWQSLADAEKLSSQIQEIVMDEGGPLGPQIKSGESRDAPEPLEPPLPDGPTHEE